MKRFARALCLAALLPLVVACSGARRATPIALPALAQQPATATAAPMLAVETATRRPTNRTRAPASVTLRPSSTTRPTTQPTQPTGEPLQITRERGRLLLEASYGSIGTDWSTTHTFVWWRNGQDQQRLYALKLPEGTLRELLRTDMQFDYSHFAPDERSVLLVHSNGVDQTKTVLLAPLEGGKQTLLYTTAAEPAEALVAPQEAEFLEARWINKRFLLLSFNRSQVHDYTVSPRRHGPIYLVDTATSQARQLTPDGLLAALLPDHELLVRQGDATGALVLFEPPYDQEPRLVRPAGATWTTSWQPRADGQQLAWLEWEPRPDDKPMGCCGGAPPPPVRALVFWDRQQDTLTQVPLEQAEWHAVIHWRPRGGSVLVPGTDGTLLQVNLDGQRGVLGPFSEDDHYRSISALSVVGERDDGWLLVAAHGWGSQNNAALFSVAPGGASTKLSEFFGKETTLLQHRWRMDAWGRLEIRTDRCDADFCGTTRFEQRQLDESWPEVDYQAPEGWSIADDPRWLLRWADRQSPTRVLEIVARE